MGSGLGVGLSGLTAGYTIGVVGDTVNPRSIFYFLI